jgi:hypothetical protein
MNDIVTRFKKSVNMSPGQIRSWAKDPRAKEASFKSTRSRLPRLAALKSKPASQWTAADYHLAKRVLSFNARMEGMVRVHGCTRKAVISLRNWGRQPPKCPIPERKK